MSTPAAARRGLYHRFIAEEVASGLRHRVVNKLAGVGALAFHLKRQLPAGAAGAAAAAVVPLLEAELGLASAALELRWLPPIGRTPAVALAAVAAETVRTLELPGVTGPPPHPATAAVDQQELDLALSCLLENAGDAGARARVRCLALPASGAPLVAVEVADDGPGLVGEAALRAREAFFSTRPGRLGLGLNVAARIAQRWGGCLELESTPEGLRARLVFPGWAR